MRQRDFNEVAIVVNFLNGRNEFALENSVVIYLELDRALKRGDARKTKKARFYEGSLL